jgi:RNA polymerase sigma factor (sigma-70 family)
VEGRPLEESAGATRGDAELVARAQRGDPGAYEALVRCYQEVALRTAYLVTGDGAEAEDAAQEAFIKAYYALRRFRPGAPFRPWLLQIVANEARNRRRASGRRGGLALRAAAERPSGDAAPSPEAAALDDEQHRALLDAVNGLRHEDRLVVTYRYFLDLSEEEMAEALGCARGTVKSRLSRALGRLRECLASVNTGKPTRLGVGDD